MHMGGVEAKHTAKSPQTSHKACLVYTIPILGTHIWRRWFSSNNAQRVKVGYFHQFKQNHTAISDGHKRHLVRNLCFICARRTQVHSNNRFVALFGRVLVCWWRPACMAFVSLTRFHTLDLRHISVLAHPHAPKCFLCALPCAGHRQGGNRQARGGNKRM